MRGPLTRTRATPTPSTSLVSTSWSFCRKSGMSSCRVACIWAGGHLRARVTWMASRVITMMTSKACTPSRMSCTRMRTCSAQVKMLDGCLLTSIDKAAGVLYGDGGGGCACHALVLRLEHLQHHLVALLTEGNAGDVASLVCGADADARHGPPGVDPCALSRLWSPVHESPFLLLGQRPAAKRGQAPALLALRSAWRVETPWVLARVVAVLRATLDLLGGVLVLGLRGGLEVADAAWHLYLGRARGWGGTFCIHLGLRRLSSCRSPLARSWGG
eukprot:scaffold1206_cov124-Isochrysis_galbana.AAC.4